MTKISKAEFTALDEETRLVVAGRDPSAYHGFVNTPVFRGSTILSPTVAALQEKGKRYTYGRRGTPNSDALQEALTAIDGSAAAVFCPSGLSAVSTALFAALSAGDHLLMTDSVYGPARHFCDGPLKRLGVSVTYYDPLVGAGIEALLRPETKAVYVETPGSLTFEVQDLPAIAEVAHRHGALVIADNTWATPLFLDAHALGADLVVQAGTKYIVGHSDAMFGIVTANEAATARLRAVHGDLGLCASPDDTFLALRGLRTLAIRLARHQETALHLARWFAGRPEVLRVIHPALESDPGHAVFQRDFRGASGLFAIVLQPGGPEGVAAFLDGLKLFGLGYSWGGFESLAIPFDASTSRTATSWAPGGPCVRVHAGLEDPDDLIADLEAGLARYAGAAIG